MNIGIPKNKNKNKNMLTRHYTNKNGKYKETYLGCAN
jgi:hypothetical protein